MRNRNAHKKRRWKQIGKTLGKRREERHWVRNKNPKKEWSMRKEGGGKSNRRWGLEARGFTKKHSLDNLVIAWSPTRRILRKSTNKLIEGPNPSVRIILLVGLGTTDMNNYFLNKEYIFFPYKKENFFRNNKSSCLLCLERASLEKTLFKETQTKSN